MKACLFYSLLVLSFLGTRVAGAATRGTIERLDEDIAQLQTEIDKISAREDEVSKMVFDAKQAAEELHATSARLKSLEYEIGEMEFLYNIYRGAFLIRSELENGDLVNAFTTSEGELIPESTFLGTVEDGIKVQTLNGVIVISSSELPVELKEKVYLPPEISAPSMTLEELMEVKPSEARSEEEMELNSVAEGKAQELESEKASEAERSGISAKRDALRDEISALKEKRSSLYKVKGEIEAARYQKSREFRRATVKKAQVHIDEVLGEYDAKIANIEQQRELIKRRILELEDQL